MKRDIKIGLALGGGGARGAAHIGILYELEKANIPIDLIVGTSVGSIIGAFYACGCPLDKIREIFAGIKLGSLRDFRFFRKGIYSANFIERLCEKTIGNIQFSELSIPMAAIATDLKSGESMIIQDGLVKKALSASSAFVTNFTPVEMDGHIFVDGGILSNVPVSATSKLGADFLIAVDLGSAPITEEGLNILSVPWRAIDIMIRKITNEELKHADWVIRPDIDQFPIFDFKKCDELVQKGKNAAIETIPAIKNVLDSYNL